MRKIFLTICLCLVFFIFSTVQAAPSPEGSLVVFNGTVYLIKGGQRYPFRSPEVFHSHGYQFGQVKPASSEDIALPEGTVMIYRDGSLVKAPDKPLVYLVTQSKKRGFNSAEAFFSLGYEFSNVVSSNPETFADLPEGEIITVNDSSVSHPSGTLVQHNGTVFLITPAGKKGFPSAEVFRSHGYEFRQVATANSLDIALPDVGFMESRSVLRVADSHTPSSPQIIGSTTTQANAKQNFSISSIDPDGDHLSLIVDWGDGTQKTSSQIASGSVFNAEHIWIAPGTYTISATVTDNYRHSANSNFLISVTPFLAVPNETASWIAEGNPQIDSKYIQWSTARKLTWDDFRGPIVSNDSREGAAVGTPVKSIANTSYKCENTGTVKRCSSRFDSFSVVALMDPDISWVLVKDSYGLAHEQTHFDIAEVMARKLKNQLSVLIGTSETREAFTEAVAIDLAKQALLTKKQNIEASFEQELNGTQELYDADTNHSLKKDIQAVWDACVSSWLVSLPSVIRCQLPVAQPPPSPPAPAPVPPPPACIPSISNTAPVGTQNAIGSITINSPNGGECLTKSSSHVITWSSSSNIDQVSIGYSFGAGSLNWIATGISNIGLYNWTVNVGSSSSTQAKIQITGYQTGFGSVTDSSDGFFTVSN